MSARGAESGNGVAITEDFGLNGPTSNSLPTAGDKLVYSGRVEVPSPVAEIDEDGVAAFVDMGRLMQMYSNGELGEYIGLHVAMVDGKIVGSGKDPYDLEQHVSRELGVPLHRVALWSCSDAALIG